MVHVREGTDDDLLVVGIMLDTTTFGLNIEVGATAVAFSVDF